MNTITYDVIVVGTGVAGLYTALSLPTTCNILMITKDELTNSDSYLAQGGISTLLNESDYDSYYEDTMRAGRYENNPTSVRVMIENSRHIINRLIDYDVDFDKDADGALSYTREGAHSTFRILHHKDVTGKEIVTKLIAAVKSRSNIHIMEYTTMIDFITKKNNCHGIVVTNQDDSVTALYAKSVVLATGGLGGLFKNSTNFPHITGDSFAIALKHQVALEHINYIQIHPTVLYSKKKERRFLISESVRGEGAILLNEKGERFVDELLPRDVVSEAICKEMQKFHTDHVYLTLPTMTSKEAADRFPNIFARCLEEGYDMTKDRVPVTPAQHYLMGGIKADTYGQTSMKRLFAVGETACNGVHGANRLASNSLLESLVFAERAGKVIEDEFLQDSIETVPIDDKYTDSEQLQHTFESVVMNEIKREDETFYDKWCNNEN